MDLYRVHSLIKEALHVLDNVPEQKDAHVEEDLCTVYGCLEEALDRLSDYDEEDE